MTYRRISVALTCVFLATCPVMGESAGRNTITIRNFTFSPNSLTISAGAAVTWKNLDGEPHTVGSDQGLFRSEALDEGDSYTFKFDKAGAYRFICSIHPTMSGTIVVK
ncbi:MAG TPA: cupredoxin family copper-binding protein [Micropepsaceae bacterium]|nr:cupredoxin family copper-binding protein [Micropepsaceae bacterium]